LRGKQTRPGSPGQGRYQVPPGQYPPPYQQPYPPGYYGPYGHPPPIAPPPETPRQALLRRVGLVGASAFLLIPFIILLSVFMLVVFVGRPYIVHGESMLPTLHDGDRVFVVPYRGNTTPSRGDVIVLRDIAGSPEMLIKRVVAIGGDRVRVENGSIVRYVPESYSTTVPDGYVFVMGDNQEHSFDSRTFGAVPGSKVVGKALVIFWPPSDAGKL
jgi:signal peptidase I